MEQVGTRKTFIKPSSNEKNVFVAHSRSFDALHDLSNHASIELNCDHALRLLQQANGKITGSGTDFQDNVGSLDCRAINDPL